MTQQQRKSGSNKAAWVGPLALVLALMPAMGVALQAAADDGIPDQEDVEQAPVDESPWEARKRVLAAIPHDQSILINVTDREMPASPDILNLGKRGTRALSRCLSDNIDGGIRQTCAMLLGRLGDRAALPALQAALDDWEPSVRYRVIEALALIPDATSFEPLVKLYRRADEEVYNRTLILIALGTLSNTKAVHVLRDEVRKKPEKDQTDLRPAAFQALWLSRHLTARATLISDVAAALRSDSDALVLSATEASAELRAPQLVNPLTPLMEHRNPNIRNKAVYALGLVGDRSATKALLARLPGVRDARMLNNIAFALERLESQRILHIDPNRHRAQASDHSPQCSLCSG